MFENVIFWNLTQLWRFFPEGSIHKKWHEWNSIFSSYQSAATDSIPLTDHLLYKPVATLTLKHAHCSIQ